jgi:predicted SAM-dependent methyltransferase
MKASPSPDVVNIDWSVFLLVKKSRVLRTFDRVIFNGERLRRFRALPQNILYHNIKRGIPFESASLDVVYHSHLFEHLDKEIAEKFQFEVLRVLKPGGIQRIVVPDFERACIAYVSHISVCEHDPLEAKKHDDFVARILRQSVQKEAAGTSEQPPLRRFLENLFLGDARKRGETHQWMYDRINLRHLLLSTGFREVEIQEYSTSLVPGWNDYGLDIDEDGTPHKSESLYVEAIK